MAGESTDRHTVHVGSQRLAVSIRGEGRPLLLINGIGATGELFDPFRDAVADIDDRQTIAFDAPGVGHSPATAYPPTMRQLARTVAGLIDELGHEQIDVLGISWGGALAQELTHRHPHRVRRLVLAATMHGWTSVPGQPSAVSILMTPARYYSVDYLEKVAPTLYGGQIRENPELLRQHAHIRATRPPSAIGYTWQLAALRRWTSLPWLHRVAHRTLVLAGDDDPIIPLANGEQMARRLPEGELHVVEGGGHLFLYLQAALSAERVVDFLDRD
ncbi:MAG: alpha/beta fold hydrolase [Actinomycetia bacterium]|nr:alpha/beta fold hydrolase [Actinomycetes bacterium]